MKPMRGIYDGKIVRVLDPVPVDRPTEVEIVPIGPAAGEIALTSEQVHAKLAMLFASLQGLSEEQQASLEHARIDQESFFRSNGG